MPTDTFIAPYPGAHRRRHGRLLAFLLSPIFHLYETRLLAAVRADALPRHVGIILDGNRRYARKYGITDPRTVCDIGARKLDDVLDWCAEIDIPAVRLWVFSPDNLRRPTAEVSGILAAIAQDARIHGRRVRVRALGKLVPESVRAAFRTAEAATGGYDGMVLNIAVGYGGRREITDAVAALLTEGLNAAETLAGTIAALMPEAIPTRPASLTPTSLSEPAARFASPASCCGRAPIASSSSTSPTCIGRNSARSISFAPIAAFSPGSAVSGCSGLDRNRRQPRPVCAARPIHLLTAGDLGMRVFKWSFAGAVALLIFSFGPPASAENLQSVVGTLNAIVNPDDVWRLEDQARRYQRHDEARYWHGYAGGLERQRRGRGEPVPEYHGWGGYQTPIGPDEAYRMEGRARRFGYPDAQDYWRRYREGGER